MSKDWYPVIDLEKCNECNACVEFCKHGVFEVKNGRAAVVNPQNCVRGCTGCQPICGQGAISHVGEASPASCCCSKQDCC